MDPPRGLLLMEAVKLIERASALADLVGLLNCFSDVSLGENHGLAKLQSQCKLRGDSR